MPDLDGDPITDRERAIIEAAHWVVIEWFHDHHRESFRTTILQRSRSALTDADLAPSDYPAFRRVANLTRTGQGHPTENPEPLIAATRDLPDISLMVEEEGDAHGSDT
jgi:hypothetical protein